MLEHMSIPQNINMNMVVKFIKEIPTHKTALEVSTFKGICNSISLSVTSEITHEQPHEALDIPDWIYKEFQWSISKNITQQPSKNDYTDNKISFYSRYFRENI